jgi:hypothetical protein
MGRRKIEIKAIKDDRNRSVYVFIALRMRQSRPTLTLDSTFLKRKGGLFKKAHELSVLCSVDVAVIIFGHNKKLYEFSSGDINETIGRYQYVSTHVWRARRALNGIADRSRSMAAHMSTRAPRTLWARRTPTMKTTTTKRAACRASRTPRQSIP